jgi:hypothetical protein
MGSWRSVAPARGARRRSVGLVKAECAVRCPLADLWYSPLPLPTCVGNGRQLTQTQVWVTNVSSPRVTTARLPAVDRSSALFATRADVTCGLLAATCVATAVLWVRYRLYSCSRMGGEVIHLCIYMLERYCRTNMCRNFAMAVANS